MLTPIITQFYSQNKTKDITKDTLMAICSCGRSKFLDLSKGCGGKNLLREKGREFVVCFSLSFIKVIGEDETLMGIYNSEIIEAPISV